MKLKIKRADTAATEARERGLGAIRAERAARFAVSDRYGLPWNYAKLTDAQKVELTAYVEALQAATDAYKADVKRRVDPAAHPWPKPPSWLK